MLDTQTTGGVETCNSISEEDGEMQSDMQVVVISNRANQRAPVFVTITERGSELTVLDAVKAKGLRFFEGMRPMSLSYGEGILAQTANV